MHGAHARTQLLFGDRCAAPAKSWGLARASGSSCEFGGERVPKQARQPARVHEDRALAGPDLASLDRSDEAGERLRCVHGIKNEPLAARRVIEREPCLIGQLLVSRANLTLVDTQAGVARRPR